MSMRDDQTRHSGAVAVVVFHTLCVAARKILSWQDISYQVGMVSLHSRVDDANDNAVSLAELLGFCNVQNTEMPLIVASCIRSRRLNLSVDGSIDTYDSPVETFAAAARPVRRICACCGSGAYSRLRTTSSPTCRRPTPPSSRSATV